MKFEGRVVTASNGEQASAWRVSLDGRKLRTHSEVRNHSEGFAWGYAGSGPAQLALAIMVEYLSVHPEDHALARRAGVAGHGVSVAEVALAVYQRFKVNVIQNLPKDDPWSLNERDIHLALVRMAGDDPTASEVAEIGTFQGLAREKKERGL